jgi:hypothetical protein
MLFWLRCFPDATRCALAESPRHAPPARPCTSPAAAGLSLPGLLLLDRPCMPCSTVHSAPPAPRRAQVRGRRRVPRLLRLGVPQVRPCGGGHRHRGQQDCHQAVPAGHPRPRQGQDRGRQDHPRGGAPHPRCAAERRRPNSQKAATVKTLCDLLRLVARGRGQPAASLLRRGRQWCSPSRLLAFLPPLQSTPAPAA